MNTLCSLVFVFGALAAQAETVYTTLDDTVVQDKPDKTGSTVIAHLKAGSMIETVKAVGGFTAISFIMDGKVKTGYVTTLQIKNDPSQNSKIPVATANGLQTENDSSAPRASTLDALSISESDLATFAKNGKLMAREPKSKVTQ